MTAYAPVRIGPKREKRADGSLLVRDVRMSRVGQMTYGAGEVPVPPGPDGRVQIERLPDVVFDPVTMASFVGNPITLKHPEDMVNTSNWRDRAHGTILSTRRGEGSEADFMIGDILITTDEGIAALENLNEVSCGYDADFETIRPGLGRQTKIVGNHLALVAKGRCGPQCYVGDQSMDVDMTEKTQSPLDVLRKLLGMKDEAGMMAVLDAAAHDQAIAAKDGEIATLTASVTALTADVSRLTGELAEAKKTPVRDAVTVDIAALHPRVVMAAEILAPGTKVPVLDAAADATATYDAVCACQRDALATAHATPTGKLVVEKITGPSPDFAKMTADQASAAFFAASALAGAANNSAVAHALAGAMVENPMRSGFDAIKAADERSQKRWAKPAAVTA